MSFALAPGAGPARPVAPRPGHRPRVARARSCCRRGVPAEPRCERLQRLVPATCSTRLQRRHRRLRRPQPTAVLLVLRCWSRSAGARALAAAAQRRRATATGGAGVRRRPAHGRRAPPAGAGGAATAAIWDDAVVEAMRALAAGLVERRLVDDGRPRPRTRSPARPRRASRRTPTGWTWRRASSTRRATATAAPPASAPARCSPSRPRCAGADPPRRRRRRRGPVAAVPR